MNKLSNERLSELLSTVTTAGRRAIPAGTPCFWDAKDRVCVHLRRPALAHRGATGTPRSGFVNLRALPGETMDPFFIEGPAVISLSGGRTSAYMLRRILDAGLQPDVHVLFCNTGKEYEETLTFVNEVGARWGVDVKWLEYHRRIVPQHRSAAAASASLGIRRAHNYPTAPRSGKKEQGFLQVDYRTASRQGEPYLNFVAMSGLPNPAFRTCTTEMKVRPMKRWMIAMGYKAWDMVMGIRADEPRRVAKLRHSPPERWEHVMPLADAGVTEADVLDFWKAQPFDLGLAVDPESWGRTVATAMAASSSRPTSLFGSSARSPDASRGGRTSSATRGPSSGATGPTTEHLRMLATGLGDADLGDCFCHD